MDFRLSDEQRLLRETIRRISLKEFAPRAAEIDEAEDFPWDNQRILAQNGIFGIQCPVEYGGSGPGMVSLAITIEEVARVCASTAHIITTQAMCTDAFILRASHEQKLKWLPPLARGSVLGAIAITEPDAGSDVVGIKTVAQASDGGYLINGYKRFITHGGVAETVIVVAYTDKAKGHDGISLFAVAKGTEGFSVGNKERKLGLRGSNTTDLVFEDCLVPEENRIGMEGEGFKVLMKMFNYSRPAVAAQAVGISQGALDAVLDYSRQRTQFGKSLAEFQGLQWMMAEMALKVELARTLVYRTCATIDHEPDAAEIPRLASMAKWFASDTAMQVTTDAVQFFGGYGCSKEYPVERMMRDAKITQVYEGTNQIQRIIVSRQLLGSTR